MDMYLGREALRLEGIFLSQIQSTSTIHTQPLLEPPVSLVPLIVAKIPSAASPIFMESPIRPTSPASPIHPPVESLDDSPWIDELPPVYVRETEVLQRLNMESPRYLTCTK